MPFTHPFTLLRIEELGLLVCTVLLYNHLHYSWLLFAILFLAPDLFMLGYLLNVRVGAAIYNLGHALFFPLSLFVSASLTHHPTTAAVGLIWVAHIFWDRMLGYGLKYPTNFKDTHLQHIS